MAATNAAAPASFAPATLPEWITIALAVIGVAGLMGVVFALNRIHDRLPKSSEHPKKDFVRMLCDQVWKHTDAMTNVFGERMRLQPTSIDQLRVLVRNLREDISAPAYFVDQMRAHPPATWPKLDLLNAFDNWAGQIKAMESQLADLQQALTYPVVKEPVDKQRDAMLVHFYLTEQAPLQRKIDRLRNLVFDICAAAKTHLASKKHKHGHDHDEEEDAHPDCPCCRKREGDHNAVRVESPILLPVVPPTPPPPPPAEKSALARTCLCAMPVMCHCARCSCSCACMPVVALPAPAKA